MKTDLPPIVETSHLTKIFRDFWRRPKVQAVTNLSISIAPGEIFGLLGPNGSGKSTTIKMMLGLLHPSSGEIRVLGHSASNVKAKSRIGYLPEESYLYNYLSPRETLTFYGQLFDMKRTTLKERTEQLLDMVGLRQAADRPVGEFSKGMARRVGLAQALINDPELIILDEPTSGLDPIGCRQVKDLMKALAKRGKTIILSSHLLADVEDVCDRVAILYNGVIRATGRVNDLLEQQDQLRFTVPNLPANRMNEIIQLLKTELGNEPHVDRPSMNLEQFFLDVVANAHQSTDHASGVGHSKGVAQYLAHD